MRLPPGVGLASWAAFHACPCGLTMVMGDTCVKRSELQQAIDALSSRNVLPRARIAYNTDVGANPHDAHLRMCWKICRYGRERMRDAEARAKVLARLERPGPEFEGHPYVAEWLRLLRDPDGRGLADLDAMRDFFDLPDDRRAWWRPLIQSQPFSCIFPGRTTRERREFLSRLP